MSGEPETVAGRPVSVSVVMPSGHTHTLSHVFDYDSPQAWDCGTVGISVTDGHLVTVDFRALSEARSAARAEAFAEIRRGVEGMAQAPSDLSAESLFRREGWDDVLALLPVALDPPPVTVASGVIEKVLRPSGEPEDPDWRGHMRAYGRLPEPWQYPSGEPEPGGLDVERLVEAIRGVTDAHLWGVYAAGRSAWVSRPLFAREVAAEYVRLAATSERPADEVALEENNPAQPWNDVGGPV